MKLPVLSKAVKNALTAFVLCILFYIFLPFVIVRWLPQSADFFDKHSYLMLLPSAVIALVIMAVCRNFFITADDFKDIPCGRIILCNIGMTILCALASLLWMRLLDVLNIEYDTFVAVEALISQSHGVGLFFTGISVCAVIPLAEEIIFRRVIFSGVFESGKIVFSATAASLIFALLHGILFQLLPLFMLGLYFQILYIRTGKLGASFFAHALNNSFAFGCLLMFREIF